MFIKFHFTHHCSEGGVIKLILMAQTLVFAHKHTAICTLIQKLEKKAMTNLDSIIKSRDITLLAKVCPVKAMFLPLVMYGCESWITKKAEH